MSLTDTTVIGSPSKEEPLFSPETLEAMKLSANSLFKQTEELFSELGPRFASGDFMARQSYVKRFGWAVLDKKACEGIVTLTCGHVLSPGSGLGTWEACLQPMLADSNRSIICTDVESQRNPFMKVEVLNSSDAVRKYGSTCETCFVCWPAYKDPHTFMALQARPTPFTYVVYIGEGHGGCTGDDQLHEFLDSHYTCQKVFDIPQWGGMCGIHDFVQIFKRKK
jgi:hypothetical protein